jgi:hypothetical protein
LGQPADEAPQAAGKAGTAAADVLTAWSNLHLDSRQLWGSGRELVSEARTWSDATADSAEEEAPLLFTPAVTSRVESDGPEQRETKVAMAGPGALEAASGWRGAWIALLTGMGAVALWAWEHRAQPRWAFLSRRKRTPETEGAVTP